MVAITRTGNIIELNGKVRIEPGPARLTDIATAELLGALTAEHYHLPYPDPETGETVYARDADGKPIEEGKEFSYIDWKLTQSAPVHYLYRLEALTPEECEARGCDEGTEIWRELGEYPSEDEAMGAAIEILGE